uniref:SET domain-containing protein n=1 Tax=Macrostomum lignano TaxID=282301 RepID=A0A1I8FNP9_9PLAT
AVVETVLLYRTPRPGHSEGFLGEASWDATHPAMLLAAASEYAPGGPGSETMPALYTQGAPMRPSDLPWRVTTSDIRSVHEDLGVNKKAAKWVPRILSPEQKQQRIDFWQKFPDQFKDGASANFQNIVTEQQLQQMLQQQRQSSEAAHLQLVYQESFARLCSFWSCISNYSGRLFDLPRHSKLFQRSDKRPRSSSALSRVRDLAMAPTATTASCYRLYPSARCFKPACGSKPKASKSVTLLKSGEEVTRTFRQSRRNRRCTACRRRLRVQGSSASHGGSSSLNSMPPDHAADSTATALDRPFGNSSRAKRNKPGSLKASVSTEGTTQLLPARDIRLSNSVGDSKRIPDKVETISDTATTKVSELDGAWNGFYSSTSAKLIRVGLHRIGWRCAIRIAPRLPADDEAAQSQPVPVLVRRQRRRRPRRTHPSLISGGSGKPAATTAVASRPRKFSEAPPTTRRSGIGSGFKWRRRRVKQDAIGESKASAVQRQRQILG